MSGDHTVDDIVAPQPEVQYGVPSLPGNGVDVVLFPTLDEYVACIKALADDGFHLPTDLTAVDYSQTSARALPPGTEPERFEIVVHLRDMLTRRIVRVRVQVPADRQQVPSLYDIFPGTEAMEREVFDMFGLAFDGHPDLTRILMPETWDGHPLRKDYDPGRIPVQFKEANS